VDKNPIKTNTNILSNKTDNNAPNRRLIKIEVNLLNSTIFISLILLFLVAGRYAKFLKFLNEFNVVYF
jgi:hypothetical protein